MKKYEATRFVWDYRKLTGRGGEVVKTRTFWWVAQVKLADGAVRQIETVYEAEVYLSALLDQETR